VIVEAWGAPVTRLFVTVASFPREEHLACSLAMEGLLAWLSYLAGSLGYLAADGMAMFDVPLSDSLENGLYTALAALFVLNALQYARLWWAEGRRRPNLEMWAELLNLLASLLYLLSAFLFFLYPISTGTTVSRAHATVQSGLNFAGVLLFALSACMYNCCFALRRLKARRRSLAEGEEEEQQSLFRSTEFHAELFNTVPSAGYLATGLVQFFSLLVLAGKGDVNPDAELDQLLRTMRSLNVLFDLLFVLDASLFGALWLRERREAATVPLSAEEKKLEKERQALLEPDDFRDMRRMMWGVSSVNVRSVNEDDQRD
jgi:hypothetical protein